MTDGRVVFIVVGVLLASSVAVATPDGIDEYCPGKPGSDGANEPGQQLAGVVGEQQSVVARELETRGFNATLDNATGTDERAAVVAAELDRIDARIEALEACRDALEAASESGDIGQTAFDDRVEALDSALADLQDRLNRTERVARTIHDRVRRDHDIEQDRFDDLHDRIDELTSFVDASKPVETHRFGRGSGRN